MDPSIQSFKDFLLYEKIQTVGLFEFSINLLIAAILSTLLAVIYIKFGNSLSNRKIFAKNFVILCITTTFIITVVKSSLALSLGLVGALSIVRFRAAIKEPEELVYLFLVISIGLANGANQFLLSIIATAIIVSFLLLRNYYHSKNKNSFQYSADANVLNMSILNNNKKDITEITSYLKKEFKYLKLKSANFEQNKSHYVFWYEIEENNVDNFLKVIKEISDENLNISIYSKSGAFE